MRAIRSNIKKRLVEDASKYGCLRKYLMNDHICGGRITFEHVWIYAGRQIDEYWSILPICAKSHSVDEYQDGGIMNKEKNEWLSLWKVQKGDLDNYPRFNWSQRKKYLEEKYGNIG